MIGTLITIWAVGQFVLLLIGIPMLCWTIYDRLRYGSPYDRINPRRPAMIRETRRLIEKAAADLAERRRTNSSGHSGRSADPRQMSRRPSTRY